MTYYELVTQYYAIDNDYIKNIKGRNATTFEESYIYQNDIIEILEGNFYKVSRSVIDGEVNVCSLKDKFSESRYPNIINSINKFSGLCWDIYLELNDLNVKIKKCSLAAFNDYCQEFTTLENKYDLSKRIFGNKSESYCDNIDAISAKKSDINILQGKIDDYQGGGPIEYNSWNTKISTLEKEIDDLESENKSHLLFMEYHLRKMEDALDGLKTLLNEALRKTTV